MALLNDLVRMWVRRKKVDQALDQANSERTSGLPAMTSFKQVYGSVARNPGASASCGCSLDDVEIGASAKRILF